MTPQHTLPATVLGLAALAMTTSSTADTRDGWSIVPTVGVSQLGDQSPAISGSDTVADGDLDVAIDAGFVAGLGLRYFYANSRWSSEVAWEYRSNDSTTTAANGAVLPDGNYASNTFFLNGRYDLTDGDTWTPYIGAGLSWLQEVDLDSEDAEGERSFSDSGAVGFQIMAGVNRDLSERFFVTGELRYTNNTGLDLEEENGNGRVTGIDYQPVTLGLGLGVRF